MQRESNTIALDDFYRIVQSQGRVKRLERRIQDILRIFKTTRWLMQPRQNPDVLLLTEDFDNFIINWNSGDNLLPMNRGLRKYPPYANFLDCLRQETQIEVPRREVKDLKSKSGHSLKEQYGINLVAFNTFRTWAVSVGHAYLSPFDRNLYWGGDWNEERPTFDCFVTACLESYHQTDKTSAFANLSHVAHLVCVSLRISFQVFEKRMNQFVEDFPGEVRFAPATIRRELSGRVRITSVRPRSEIIRERRAAELQECETWQAQWLEHRHLEDGVRVKGNQVKLIRWEVER